ncbi:maleylpyruvate isomerase N-terminal domain-containing protein [Spirilliplanes yamanashiensis]|uniref:Mycothiol-dependent maleylpyruvate isomerase metal-binding domain-containing protein n=1 Tax=Spirilliplanes yamanashiensis TaxID=42233 RepID=A0A8J4DIN8_9ACTN|nr:maleylpyruvate isomerase N-terminal domain-containing protein [Spirilliplanes yamanashiensis]MDP9817077.1 hypothetical protein [Spirilliplanes yamanashiensis]GIJ03267.1 hypothetical protein Sya03_26190 [Spirilliplanes yamanashiensis]
MDADDVATAVAELTRVLTPHIHLDWSVPAGTLDWSCRDTAAHVAHDLLAYAGQVAGAPRDAYLPMDLVVRPDAAVGEVLRVVAACGGLLVAALRAAPDGLRAWHFGPCDVGGFAALGVAEVLVHTHDVVAGLGVAWRPPEALAAGVVGRLVPGAPPGDPADVLLRHTGRVGAGGSWRWTVRP